jgi:hypothetical protein
MIDIPEHWESMVKNGMEAHAKAGFHLESWLDLPFVVAITSVPASDKVSAVSTFITTATEAASVDYRCRGTIWSSLPFLSVSHARGIAHLAAARVLTIDIRVLPPEALPKDDPNA